MPRTAVDAVADLHALLGAAAIPPPYVLTGHSTGGLIGRLYASTYPNEVAGLVLVDAIPEGVQAAMTPEQWTVYDRLLLTDPPKELAGYKDLETIDFDASFDQMRAASKATPLPPIPFIVISKGKPFTLPPGLPDWLPATLEQAWTKGQDELAQLLPIRRTGLPPRAAITCRSKSRNWCSTRSGKWSMPPALKSRRGNPGQTQGRMTQLSQGAAGRFLVRVRRIG
jgi:pimeloyl-ACP methyl ester carboxylesterase